MKMTATDCLELGVVDEVVPEPPGGAHRDPRRGTTRSAGDRRASCRRVARCRSRRGSRRATEVPSHGGLGERVSARARAPRLVRRHLRPQRPDAANRLIPGARPARARGPRPRGARLRRRRRGAHASRARSRRAARSLSRWPGLPAAVELLAATARRGGRIVVFGDYDCDGVGALAILTTVLRKLGADARPFIPHRLPGRLRPSGVDAPARARRSTSRRAS